MFFFCTSPYLLLSHCLPFIWHKLYVPATPGYVVYNSPICLGAIMSTSMPAIMFWHWANQVRHPAGRISKSIC